ncbi:helix-turn-helix domain-containing protein [Candidatus Omnitrophota bacterium]
MNIGKKIRALRKEKNMTLEDLSSSSGVAVATLSRIETEKMTGTLDSHMNIARALGIDLPELYSDVGLAESNVELKEKDSHDDVFIHTDKSAYELLTSCVLDKKMMPILLKLEPNGKTNPEQASAGIEKFLYVFDGSIEAVIGDKSYALSQGDSLYFEGSLLHYYKNTANHETKFICVISPPAL